MTLTIELPNEIATRLRLLPEAMRDRFAVAALEDALNLRQNETSDFTAVIDQSLSDMAEGKNLISFEDACRQWEDRRTNGNE